MGDPQPAERPGTSVRRGAIWPWLAMPLVALAMFFALRSCNAGMSRDAGSSGSAPASSGGIGARQADP